MTIKYSLKEDLKRLGIFSVSGGARRFVTSANCRQLVVLRIGQYLRSKGYWWIKPIYLIVLIWYKHLENITNIYMNFKTRVDAGMLIAHGNVVINDNSVIGKNFTIYQFSTLGTSKGINGKAPIVGDNVTIWAGVSVIGDVHLGNNVEIGANSVVVKNVPDKVVVVGIPAKILKQKIM